VRLAFRRRGIGVEVGSAIAALSVRPMSARTARSHVHCEDANTETRCHARFSPRSRVRYDRTTVCPADSSLRQSSTPFVSKRRMARRRGFSFRYQFSATSSHAERLCSKSFWCSIHATTSVPVYRCCKTNSTRGANESIRWRNTDGNSSGDLAMWSRSGARQLRAPTLIHPRGRNNRCSHSLTSCTGRMSRRIGVAVRLRA